MDLPGGYRLAAADIAAILRREISRGTYHVNDRLPPERRLAQQFGVARGTVREALNRLAREELVEIKPGSGTYVIRRPEDRTVEAIEHTSPLELVDARFALEPHICRLAALHGRRGDFDHIESLCRRMEAHVDDPVLFADCDAEFHRMLAECTRNTLLVWIVDQITAVRSQEEWTEMRRRTLDEEMIRTYNRQHRAILEALRTRQPEEAAERMKAHLETARLSLTRAAGD